MCQKLMDVASGDLDIDYASHSFCTTKVTDEYKSYTLPLYETFTRQQIQ